MAHLNCSDDPLSRLRFAVLKQYGKLYGVLIKEIDKALLDRAQKLLEEGGTIFEII
jgi:hypothetical protein